MDTLLPTITLSKVPMRSRSDFFPIPTTTSRYWLQGLPHRRAVCCTVAMKPVLWAILLTVPLAAQVRIAQHGIEYISVEIKGKPFIQFFIGPETNKPYLHPLRAASGKIM